MFALLHPGKQEYSQKEKENYYIEFAFKTWPELRHRHFQTSEMRAIAHEISWTNASLDEGLVLVNIAAMESYFDRKAKGKMGECGAWQIMNGKDCSANRALWLVRNQGMLGYVGCPHMTEKCAKLISHRIDRAYLYRMGFDPKPESRWEILPVTTVNAN